MSKPYTVVVILQAKPGKESELKQALIDVMQPSRLENSCLEYRLHQDLNHLTQFLLYENWKSKEAHQQQFQKSYIIALIEQLDQLLAEPYQAHVAEEINIECM